MLKASFSFVILNILSTLRSVSEIKGMMWQKYGDAYCKTLKTPVKSTHIFFALGQNLGMIPSYSPRMATFMLMKLPSSFFLVRWHSFFFPSDWPTAKILFCIHRICDDKLEQPNIFKVEEQGGTLKEVIQTCACSTYSIPCSSIPCAGKAQEANGESDSGLSSSWDPQSQSTFTLCL